VRELVRQNFRFFLFATLAALALRLFFVFRFPAVVSDSLVYGDIAKNWLQHSIYGITGLGDITPTYIRLPGYPAFLAAIFAIFGMEHYRAALFVQIFVDTGTCFVIADIARRLMNGRAAKAAFLAAALCPFMAAFAAAALTETWEIFFTVLALDLALTGLEDFGPFAAWLGCGLATGAAILLRPDGGLLLAALALFFLLLLMARKRPDEKAVAIVKAGAIVACAALAPLIPWTLRNLHTFNEFQPLAPRYANDSDDSVPYGFNRWVKTWMADYASVEEIYWPVPGGSIDADNLPSRAFDSDNQRNQTEELFNDYNKSLRITPDLDARFEALAAARIHHAPLRYYVWLPLLRIADMWLRPRTGTLPCNTRWWEFDEDPPWLALGITLGLLNLACVGAGVFGLWRIRFTPALGLLITFVLLRSAFLGTMENPEPRYTMECYPIVIVLLAANFRRKSPADQLADA